MNTQHLKYAIEVGKTGSITQAAENLYIGQPSLSKALKELEESLGIIIFKRTSKGAVPTAQGERFLEYAREVLRQVEKMELLARADHLTTQQLHISVARASYINDAVQAMLADMDPAQEMDVRIVQTSAVRAIQHVADDQSELAVIRYPVRFERYFFDYLAEKKLAADPLWEGEPALLMHKDHPLALVPEITMELLNACPQVHFEDEGVPYLAMDEMDEMSISRRIDVSDSAMMLRTLQAMPSACAWDGDITPEQAERAGLVLRVTGCVGRVRDAVIYPQGYAFRRQDRRFIDQLFIARNKMMYGNAEMLEME